MRKTGPTNIHTQDLIVELKKLAIKNDVPLWKRIASDLEKPTRQRRIVNLSRINRFVNDDETIIVPGKVLGSGNLDKKVTIAALSFSDSAKKVISDSKGTALDIAELMKKNPKGSKVRIIG